ncbi:MAG: hypothetical protein M1833_007077 [Piccolia ochrophora]|nr:MAG: hypothetical protein M1833_007077 [Piccolia ochrophora]
MTVMCHVAFRRLAAEMRPVGLGRAPCLLVRPTSSIRSPHSLLQRRYASANAYAAPPPTPPTFRTFLTFTTLTLVFATAGFLATARPGLLALNDMMNPPSDAETLTMFQPTDDLSAEIDRFIHTHPLARRLRADPRFTEARPHMKIPEMHRVHNLTGGTLSGPGRLVVPPLTWSETGGKSLVAIQYLGEDLCGHPGIVHGGMLATLLDEGLARCCFPALPGKLGMTASLSIDYRKPAPSGSFVVLRAETTKVEGRKAWVKGRIETLVGEGEEPTVLVEASALFIEPKNAAGMTRLFPIT